MKSVLFVCLGNICRSPMAEGILRHKAESRGLQLRIDSAGTESIHAGESPDKRAVLTAQSHGIDISRLIARQIKQEDFDLFDTLLVADDTVYREVLSMVRNEKDKKKIDFIMNSLTPASGKGVPDPYYGGMDGFEKVYDMLDKACEAFLTQGIK
jgi:protein-tyrosine phosphatase